MSIWMSHTTMIVAEPGLLERELWLLALCWTAGWSISWELIDRALDGLARVHPIRAQA